MALVWAACSLPLKGSLLRASLSRAVSVSFASLVNNLPLDNCPFRCYIIPMSETYDPNSNLDPQNSDHRLARIGSEEYYDEKPDFSQSVMNDPYDGFEGCWPGDGSGMDDLADYNAMEGGDIC